MNYDVISVIKSPSLTQGEDKEVSGELNGNSPRFPKDGFPPLSEQGDNICQIKWYKEVCSRKTYTIKHWLKGAPEIWVGLHDQCQNGDSIINSLRMNFRPLTNKNRVARRKESKQHPSLVGTPVGINTRTQERMVMVRSITVSRILKRWWNSHDILDIKDGNTPM